MVPPVRHVRHPQVELDAIELVRLEVRLGWDQQATNYVIRKNIQHICTRYVYICTIYNT